MSKILSPNQLRRMPRYLHALKEMKGDNLLYVNCQTLASRLGLNKEQVRKDIATISSLDGIPNKGRDINILIKDIENILGLKNINNAILVGAGSLGKALLGYKGFLNYGLNIVAAFDNDPKVIGQVINGIKVYDITDIKKIKDDLNALIGIITTPLKEAEQVAKILEDIGIEAIWNFAPTIIDVNKDIIVANIDMASNLATLSHKLYLKHKKDNKGE